MKKLMLFVIIACAFVACNVPKDGEQENVPTSKLEVLTNLGDSAAIKDSAATK